jgi:hypothetical protein
MTVTGAISVAGNSGWPGNLTNTGLLYHGDVNGTVVAGVGSTYDLVLVNKVGASVMAVPTGTQNANFGGTIQAAGATQTGPVKIRYYNATKISNGHIQLTETTGDPYWQMNVGLFTDGAAYNGTIDVLHGKLFLQPSGQLTQVDGPLTVVGALTASGGLAVTGAISATAGFAPNVQTAAADSITPTFSNDLVERLAATGAITLNNPTGTAINGAGVVIRLRSAGAQTISFGSQYRAVGTTLPAATIGAKLLILGMIYSATDTKWDVVSVAQEA